MSTESIERYRALLPIPKHRLDEALEVQATVHDDLHRITARKATALAMAKDDLARVEARLMEDFKESEAKISVASLDAKIRRHRERIQAFDDYHAAREEHEEWLGVLDAWRQRGYAIKTLAELFIANYFAATKTSIGSDDGVRVRMREAGRDVERDRPVTRRRISS